MALKRIKQPRARTETFSNLLWFRGYTPKEMEFLAAQNELTCVCYLGSTPIKSALFFHIKEAGYA
jgi:hypothetical protein